MQIASIYINTCMSLLFFRYRHTLKRPPPEKNERNFNGGIVFSTKMPIKIPYRKNIYFQTFIDTTPHLETTKEFPRRMRGNL